MASTQSTNHKKTTITSPIPRSHSDFNYIGLSPKEKRWSTDFSLLLPPFSRDSSGYSRLTEPPVTCQPQLRYQGPSKHLKSPTTEYIKATVITKASNIKSLPATDTRDKKPSSPNPTIHQFTCNNRINDQKSMCRSSTMEPYCHDHSLGPSSSEDRKRLSWSPIIDQRILPNSLVNSPHNNCSSSIHTAAELGCNIPYKSLGHKSTKMHPKLHTNPLPASTIHKSCTLDQNILNRSPRPMNRSSTLGSYDPLRSSPYMTKSPTLDPRILSQNHRCNHHSALMNPKIQNFDPLRKNITCNPNSNIEQSNCSMSPRSPALCSTFRNPVSGHSIEGNSEVSRSQSMRSLRRKSENSPTKMTLSNSAQADFRSSPRSSFPLVEADEFDEEDIRRLRNFTITPKGLINWGDSFRSHSLTSVPGQDHALSTSSSQWDVASTKSYPMMASETHWSCNKSPQRYKVAIVGTEDAGKTSLIRQFQTSEFICAFDTSYDFNKDYAITVILNKEESELEFIEFRVPDEDSEDKDVDGFHASGAVPFADAHVVVYSVTSRRSFCHALECLGKIKKYKRSAVLLVGNKSDLVRVRAVTTDEGLTEAKERGVPFLETSAAINHQVDDLLVATLTQIRARSSATNTGSRFARAKGLIKKFLKKACFQSRSSDNLQRL